MSSIAQHPDRLFPADPGVREVARRLHAAVESLPVISPHGHVDAAVIADDVAFPDPTTMLISPDHYVTRLLHAAGVPLEQLRVGGSADTTPREAWRVFCRHWPLFDGTASGYWLRQEFVDVFGVDDADLREETADAVYDALQARIDEPGFRPRALMAQFGIEVLATTDDPLADLAAHDRLAADPSFAPRVLPTFRPDAYTKFWADGFAANADRLIQAAGGGSTGYDGYLAGIAERRRYFAEHGAVSSDHGTHTADTLKLDRAEAAALFAKGMAGTATRAEALAFEAHMLYQQAAMAVDDGLVMTLHPGVHRNTHPTTLARFGPDTGHDIPFAVDFATGLQPLLADFGTAAGFHLIPFTIDETVFSREIAPLAGFYPSVFVGAPWWFLDAPDAMLRFRSAVTETTGFSRSSGFIDDTRAFCSIPARHDASRRVEASFLARLVAEHRVTEERAFELIVDLVDAAPRRAFKL
ncbi:glucuronate isomerase [Tersicoccus phoenicis]|uniref:Uronate isomerase n=1 Tax=Tersicoccus phoenicis TaxID=554083 RepID=A0A1R1L7X1_9MICC|nr:glucuronate isomerase [Tersicoccus phoenicis]OMH23610.1 glucuronate isomerase [Tersicoccus phoenicis]